MIKEIINKLKGAKKKKQLKEKKEKAVSQKQKEKNAIKSGTITANVISKANSKRDEARESQAKGKYKTSPIMSKGVFSTATKYDTTPNKITGNGPGYKSIHKSTLSASERADAMKEGLKAYKKKYGKRK